MLHAAAVPLYDHKGAGKDMERGYHSSGIRLL